MSVYVLSQLEIHDQEAYARYRAAGGPTVAQYGGEVLAYGDATVVDGSWFGPRTTVLRFASEEHARRWHDSPEYQAALPLRDAATTTNLVIVEGRS